MSLVESDLVVVEHLKQTIVRMVNAIDSKQWQAAHSYFADQVWLDYSSLNQQAATQMSSHDLIHQWQTVLARVMTHHMLSNFEVQLTAANITQKTATVQSHVYACHSAPATESWDCYGRYLHQLQFDGQQWLITHMTLIVHGQRGNLEFLQQVTRDS